MLGNQVDTENQEWELSKENVLPIKRGRSTKGLSASLSRHPVLAESQFEKDIESFEAQLKVGTTIDKFEVFIKYFKWVRDTFPSNTKKSLEVLERCTFELKGDESLKNEPRFVKMWIEYADMVKTPGEIFSFMQSNKIGERVALFWIAWAFIAEKAQNFKLTDQIFQKGIRRLAEPKDLLSKRYHQFQRRMARQYLNNSQIGEDTVPEVQNESNKPRKALKPISHRQTTSSRVSSQNPTFSDENQPRSTQNPSVLRSTNSAPFTIFADSNNETAGMEGLPDYLREEIQQEKSSQLVENSSWKNLGSTKERKKENEGILTKWSDGGLIDSKLNTTQIQSQNPALAPPIPIYVDEKFIINESENIENKEENETESRNRPGLSVRRKIDGEMKILSDPREIPEVDVIMKHPLTRHIQSIKNPEKVEKNTNIEKKMEIQNENKVENKSIPFSIFDDKNVKNPRESSKNLLLFPQKEKSSKNNKNVQTNKKSETGAGFSIFVDESSLINEVKSKTKEGLKPIESELNPSKTQNEDDELDNFLDNILIDAKGKTCDENGLELEDDGDGTTINTKLARRDIDSMFCSPSVKPSLKDHKPSQTHTNTQKNSLPFKIFDENNNLDSVQKRNDKISQSGKVLGKAKHQPFGTRVDSSGFSALKDVSAINEHSSMDMSLCGNLNTPMNNSFGFNTALPGNSTFKKDDYTPIYTRNPEKGQISPLPYKGV